jgi:hypothetical protein
MGPLYIGPFGGFQGGGGGGVGTGRIVAGGLAGAGLLANFFTGRGAERALQTPGAIEERIAGVREEDLARGGAGLDIAQQRLAGFDPDRFLGPEALSSVFEQATRTSFMPQLRGLQARSARRGIRGPLAGALEGDLTAGFQRNLLAEVGRNRATAAGLSLRSIGELGGLAGTRRAQGISLLGTELELDLARKQAAAETAQKRRSGLGSLLGGVAGGIAGSIIPGLGTAVGAGIGSRIGGAFS